jgi:hypothetical protein
LAIVVVVLEVTELRGGGEHRMVLVSDMGIGQQGLKTAGVSPRVLRAPNPSPLADVDQLGDPGAIECADEAGPVELIYADRRDPGHSGLR